MQTSVVWEMWGPEFVHTYFTVLKCVCVCGGGEKKVKFWL
jgi:hypothetical protein